MKKIKFAIRIEGNDTFQYEQEVVADDIFDAFAQARDIETKLEPTTIEMLRIVEISEIQ